VHNNSHVRWNFVVIILDAATFAAALALVDPVAVFPVFLRTLTDSTLVVGIMAAVQRAGWILPQLLVASLLQHRPKKRPFLIAVGFASRLPFLALALLVPACSSVNRVLLLWLVCGSFAIFYLLDGATGVPWHDIVAKSIPATLRGRFFGAMQLFGAVMAVGSGEVVRRVLSSKTLLYPHNYAVLFGVAFIIFMVSFFLLVLVREPVRPVQEEAQSLGEMLKRIPQYLRERRVYRRMIITQVLAGSGAIATSFYALYAESKLGAPASMGGFYIWTLTAGTIAGSFVWAFTNDRFGTACTVRVVCWTVILAPLAAIVLGLSGLKGSTACYGYGIVFALSAASAGGIWQGFISYLLEIVNDRDRAGFIAMTTTLTAPTILMPIIGGQLLKLIPYEAVFGIAILGGIAALLSARKMVEPRDLPLQDDIIEVNKVLPTMH
jgi:MFS family permease